MQRAEALHGRLAGIWSREWLRPHSARGKMNFFFVLLFGERSLGVTLHLPQARRTIAKSTQIACLGSDPWYFVVGWCIQEVNMGREKWDTRSNIIVIMFKKVDQNSQTGDWKNWRIDWIKKTRNFVTSVKQKNEPGHSIAVQITSNNCKAKIEALQTFTWVHCFSWKVTAVSAAVGAGLWFPNGGC